MRDSTILMLLTVCISLGFRYLRRNGLGQNDYKYDEFLPDVYRSIPAPVTPKPLPIVGMVEKFSQLIEKYPTDAGAYCNRGAVYICLKRYDDALFDFKKAIELQPSYADAFNNRGVAYYRLDQFEQAISDFTTAIFHVSDDTTYYLNRSKCYLKLRDHLKAGVDIDHALELNKKLIEAADQANTAQTAVPQKTIYNTQEARAALFKAQNMIVKYERQTYSDDIAPV